MAENMQKYQPGKAMLVSSPPVDYASLGLRQSARNFVSPGERTASWWTVLAQTNTQSKRKLSTSMV
jgi:hypothetical protein